MLDKARIRRRLIIGTAILFLAVVLGAALRHWHKTYHVPMQRARPILQLLKNPESFEDMQRAYCLLRGMRRDPETGRYEEDEDLEPVRGVGAEKVKQRVLEILATYRPEDEEGGRALRQALIIVSRSIRLKDMETTYTGLKFRGDKEWAIIQEAADHYNDKISDGSQTWHVMQVENGNYRHLTTENVSM